jgi:hypothetical protein
MKLEYDKDEFCPVAFVFHMTGKPKEEGIAIYDGEDHNLVHVFYHDKPGGMQKVEYFSSESIIKYLYKGDKISITF